MPTVPDQLRAVGAFGNLVACGLVAKTGLRAGRAHMLRPRIVGVQPPPSPADVRAFLEATGGDPEGYRAPSGALYVPPTFFCTWGMAKLVRVLAQARLPFNFARTMHASSSVRIRRLATTGEPVRFTATVETVVRTGRRVRIEQRLVMEAEDETALGTAEVALVLPDARRAPAPPGRGRELAPLGSTEVALFELGGDEGWRYAKASADFNPVHWLRPAARLVGMPGPIAHGFDLMARVAHAAIRGWGGGDPRSLRSLEVVFRKPLALPARVRLLAGAPERATGAPARIALWVAAEPGAAANLSGLAEVDS